MDFCYFMKGREKNDGKKRATVGQLQSAMKVVEKVEVEVEVEGRKRERRLREVQRKEKTLTG